MTVIELIEQLNTYPLGAKVVFTVDFAYNNIDMPDDSSFDLEVNGSYLSSDTVSLCTEQP